MSSDFNQDHFFNKKEKAYFLLCSLIIASCVVWITHLYFEYRVVNATWETTFVSPTAFWDEVPEWKWREVFNDRE
mgnify:CR=1 FL=1|jgi:hypothetical protein